MDLPTIQQLRYLVSLSEAGSFHAAASACYVSQSTLSTGIKNLETQLGTMMVDRSNRVLVFTEVGQEVVGMARDILEKSGEIVRISKQRKELLTGTLKLGGIPTILPFVIAPLLKRLETVYPHCNLQLMEDKSDALLEKLLQGRVDVLLLALPYKQVERENLQTLALFEDPFYLTCNKGMMEKLGALSPQNIPTEDLLLMSEGHCLRGHALNACSTKRNSKINTNDVSSLNTLVQLVDQGMGYTYLPEIAIKCGHLTEGFDVATQPTQSSRTISLVWRKSSSRDEEFKRFGEMFVDLVSPGSPV